MTLETRLTAAFTAVGVQVKALISGKADNTSVVHLSGTETVNGTKTFGSAPLVPVGSNLANPVRRDDSRLSDARTPTAHNHDAGDITTGVFDPARIPSTTAPASITDTITSTATKTLNADLGSDWYITATAAPTIGPPSNGINGQQIVVDVFSTTARTLTVASGVTRTLGLDATITIPAGKIATIGLRRSNGAWRLTAITADQ